MINEGLLRKILCRYKLPGDMAGLEWNPLPAYPHIVEVRIREDVYYLKELIVKKSGREWFEKVYSFLETKEMFIHPLKNRDDCYLTSAEGIPDNRRSDSASEYCYLLTEKMEEGKETPSARWWAESLAALHQGFVLAAPGKGFIGSLKAQAGENRVLLPQYSETLTALERVGAVMEKDVRNLLATFLVEVREEELLSQPGVLVHGDPLGSNVMRRGSQTVLFDFESSGLSLKEHDIQRLFADVAVNCANPQEIDRFVADFMRQYEEVGSPIDLTALDALFRLDLIRTICWLYGASAAYNRQDSDRQTLELEKYRGALRRGYFHRVLAAIHKTWQFDLSEIRINNQEEIQYVAEIISAVVPDFVCATLGGSRSHFLDDGESDVEMYFYSRSGIPALEDLNRVLEGAGAMHRRSESFLWNEEPWGPHSFFEVRGLYFEIGYRIVPQTAKRIGSYLSGEMVEPQKDCHDLGQGYLFSGLAASVQAEKIVICRDSSFFALKQLTDQFPASLWNALTAEYLDTAEKLLKGKLLVAARRQDLFFYHVLAMRVIRCLMIMAFSITGTHFPGDKWNEVLLLHTNWDNAGRVLQLFKSHMQMDVSCMEKYEFLWEAFQMIKKDAAAKDAAVKGAVVEDAAAKKAAEKDAAAKDMAGERK